jgi:hypothetical protein
MSYSSIGTSFPLNNWVQNPLGACVTYQYFIIIIIFFLKKKKEKKEGSRYPSHCLIVGLERE